MLCVELLAHKYYTSDNLKVIVDEKLSLLHTMKFCGGGGESVLVENTTGIFPFQHSSHVHFKMD